MSQETIFGIHKSLFAHTLIIVIATTLVVVMGLMLVANVLMPEAAMLFGKVQGLGSKIAFVFFGSMLVIAGFIGGVTTVLHNRRITRTVLSATPEPVHIRLIEEQWSDSTELFVELHNGLQPRSYLAKRPRWLTKDLLEIPLEAEGYFDARRNVAAVKLQQGLIWVMNSRNRQGR